MSDPIEPTRIGGPLRDAQVDPLPGDPVRVPERSPRLTRPPDGGPSVPLGGATPIRPVRRRR